MSLVVRKPIIGVSEQVLHKPDRVKTKALISCAVTAQLICVFVYVYAKSRFSHNEAHIIILIPLFND